MSNVVWIFVHIFALYVGAGVTLPVLMNFSKVGGALMGSQHPSPNVKNPLRIQTANLARNYHHVMPKVLVF